MRELRLRECTVGRRRPLPGLALISPREWSGEEAFTVNIEDRKLAPEERTRLQRRLMLKIASYLSDSLDCFSTRHVSREKNIEINQIRLFKSLIELVHLFGARLSPLDLLVCSVITWFVSSLPLAWKNGRRTIARHVL